MELGSKPSKESVYHSTPSRADRPETEGHHFIAATSTGPDLGTVGEVRNNSVVSVAPVSTANASLHPTQQRRDIGNVGVDSSRDAHMHASMVGSASSTRSQPLAASTPQLSSALSHASILQMVSVPDLSGRIVRTSRSPVFQGTYSSVYTGTFDKQKVAIKMLRIVAHAETMRRKFTREVTIWGHLSHSNVLPLLGLVESEEYGRFPAMVSPWCSNGHSGDYIRGGIDLYARVDLFRQVAQALHYLHTFDPILVHGDLKPQNVLIDDKGVAKLCDFGLIRLIHDGPRTGMTTTTDHTGTMRYLSYELVKGFGRSTPTTWSDIHAMASIGMEFIYLEPPYSFVPSRDVYGVPLEIRNGTPPAQRPLNLQSEPESALWDLFGVCWSMEPSDRPDAGYICQWIDGWRERLAISLGT